jgi:hypothetical protein
VVVFGDEEAGSEEEGLGRRAEVGPLSQVQFGEERRTKWVGCSREEKEKFQCFFSFVMIFYFFFFFLVKLQITSSKFG